MEQGRWWAGAGLHGPSRVVGVVARGAVVETRCGGEVRAPRDGRRGARRRRGGRRPAGRSRVGEDGGRRELDRDARRWLTVARHIGDPRGEQRWPARHR
jgi:hypothetical protein